MDHTINDPVTLPRSPKTSVTRQFCYKRFPLLFRFFRELVDTLDNKITHTPVSNGLEHLKGRRRNDDFIGHAASSRFAFSQAAPLHAAISSMPLCKAAVICSSPRISNVSMIDS